MAARKPAQRSTNGELVEHCNFIIAEAKKLNTTVCSPEDMENALKSVYKHAVKLLDLTRGMAAVGNLNMPEWIDSDDLTKIPRPGM